MIADIQLFNVPNHQLANRQFVVGNLGSPIKTVPNVKVANGPILDVALPWDGAFANANIVKIGDRCYDIVGIDDVTYSEKTIRMRLMYNAVTSLLRKDINGKIILEGWWERAPIPSPTGGQIAITNDTFKPKRTEFFYVNEPTSTGFKQYYYQVVTNRSIETGEEGKLSIYAGFVSYRPDILSSSISGARFIGQSRNTWFTHIGLRDMISALPTILGVPADSIMDLSITPRSPFEFVDADALNFIKNNGNIAEFRKLREPGQEYYGYATVSLQTNYLATHEPYVATMTGITEFEKYCGSFYLVDERGNEIMKIPNEYIVNDSLTIPAHTVCDITGIYTIYEICGKQYMVPEGKLPFIGSAWNDYNIRSREYDREALTRAVENARAQRDIDMINSIGNSMLTLGLAGATNPTGAVAGIAQMGLGIATSELTLRLNERNLYAEQNAKEGLIKNSPSQNYQSGNGLDYLFKSYKYGGTHIRLDMPANTDESAFYDYIKYRGYPCGMYRVLELPSDGYIKGNIYNDFSAIGNAVETDMLRKELASGCRIVVA